jgi:DNA replication protein DnaC
LCAGTAAGPLMMDCVPEDCISWQGFSSLFTTAHGPAHQLMEARDERRILKVQNQLQTVKLLIVDEPGFAPLSQAGAQLLF